MSQIASPGGPAAIAPNADGVIALLTVVANPTLHADRLADLLEAEKAAKNAYAEALAIQQTAAADKDEATRLKADVEQREKTYQENFAAWQARTSAAEADLKNREAALAARASELKAATEKSMSDTVSAAALLQQREDAMDSREKDVLRREKAVANAEGRINAKLNKLKEFEQA